MLQIDTRPEVAQRALLLSFCTPLLCCKMDWLALFTLLQSAFGLAHLLVHRCPCHCLQKQLQVNNQSVWCDIRLSCKNVILLLLNSLLPSKSTTDYQNAISVVYNVMSLVKHILVWTISGCIGSLWGNCTCSFIRLPDPTQNHAIGCFCLKRS